MKNLLNLLRNLLSIFEYKKSLWSYKNDNVSIFPLQLAIQGDQFRPFLRLFFIDPLSFLYRFIISASRLLRDSFGPRRLPDNRNRRKDDE